MRNLCLLTLTALCMSLLFTACQKNNVTPDVLNEDHHHPGEHLAFEDLPAANPDLTNLNFTVENGVLSFPTFEDAQYYTKNVSLLTYAQFAEFEAKNSFQSWSGIQKEIMNELGEMKQFEAIKAVVDRHPEYVNFGEENRLDFVLQPYSKVVNKDKIYKVAGQFYYMTKDEVLISENIQDLNNAISDKNYQAEGLHRAVMTTLERPAATRTDAVTGPCSSYSLAVYDQHFYPHNSEFPFKRLTLAATISTFFNPLINTNQTDLEYLAVNERMIAFGNIIFWRLEKCGMLGEMRFFNIDFSFSDFTHTITSSSNWSGVAFDFSDFSWVMASIWNPDWHRVGCRI